MLFNDTRLLRHLAPPFILTVLAVLRLLDSITNKQTNRHQDRQSKLRSENLPKMKCTVPLPILVSTITNL